MDCVFCKIVAGEIPCSKVYEDEHTIAFMDIAPLATYHTLLIPKKHFEFVSDCPSEISEAIGKAMPIVAKAVMKASGADGYNILNNNGSAAGQVVPHIHFHVIPRFENDKIFTQWPALDLPIEQVIKAAEDIKKHIS